MLATFEEEDGVLKGNVLLYVFCVTFLFKAESIVKSIFNVKSPGNAVGDTIASAATAGVVIKQVKNIMGSNKDNSKTNAEDKKDAEEHAKNVRQMESNASQRNKEEANRKDDKDEGSRGGDSGYTPSSSSGRDSSSDSGSAGRHAARGTGSSSDDSAPAPRVEVNRNDDRNSRIKELEKANEVLAHIASQKKLNSVPKKILQGSVSGAIRATTIASGVFAGLATGDVNNIAKFAAAGNEIGKRVGRGVNKISGAAINRLGGATMRVKAQHGGYKKQLQRAGVDVDKLYGDAKGKAILKAQGQFISAQRRGGDALGQAKMARAIRTRLVESETRDKDKKS